MKCEKRPIPYKRHFKQCISDQGPFPVFQTKDRSLTVRMSSLRSDPSCCGIINNSRTFQAHGYAYHVSQSINSPQGPDSMTLLNTEFCTNGLFFPLLSTMGYRADFFASHESGKPLVYAYPEPRIFSHSKWQFLFWWYKVEPWNCIQVFTIKVHSKQYFM